MVLRLIHCRPQRAKRWNAEAFASAAEEASSNSPGAAPDTPRPDLAKQIRPRLDELQTRLLRQYANFAPHRREPNCQALLAKARQDLTHDALHELALTRATGELCIRAPKL